jgi:hypothetical protein
VVRVLAGINIPATTYNAAQQIADFGSVQSTITVRIYQLSQTIGRGYPGIASV